MQADHSENTKRIAKNTIMLYIRMLFSMLVSLYTSRVVLNTLGVEDYGIYNVVGGFVAMFSLISSSLSSSVSRFLTFELGKGDVVKLKRIFSTSMWIHIGLSIVIFIIAETIGIWFVNNQMSIPPERLYAANCVFQASVFTFIVSLITVSYRAAIVAHERMSAFAYIGISDILCRLFVVLFIAYFLQNFDELIAYALLLLLVTVVFQSIYILYCKRHFIECTYTLSLDDEYRGRMVKFASWNLIGSSASLFKEQGVNILLNLFYGPVLNAARGIATSVNLAVVSFANNFMTAINPQITKSFANDDYVYLNSLLESGTRFSFYVLLIPALPILFETDFVLMLWLNDYPEYTSIFIKLILLQSLNEIISSTLITLQEATGKIRRYQLLVGGMSLMNFPMSYLCLNYGCSPTSVYWILIWISIICLFLRLYCLHTTIGTRFSVKKFIIRVYFRTFLVLILSSLLPGAVYVSFEAGWTRFVLVVFMSLISSVFVIYYLGCNKEEREFIQKYLRKYIKNS